MQNYVALNTELTLIGAMAEVAKDSAFDYEARIATLIDTICRRRTNTYEILIYQRNFREEVCFRSHFPRPWLSKKCGNKVIFALICDTF